MRTFSTGCILLASLSCALGSSLAAEDDALPAWPMLAHDAQRSSSATDALKPPFERKWYRLFADEGLMSGVQPIVFRGKVYIGSLRGVLHAIDCDSGQDRWTFRTGGPILHACAADGDLVFFGSGDGRVYAVTGEEGQLAWSHATGAAVWNAPLVHEGRVLIGSRDGRLYAFRATDGSLLWSAETGGPLLASPALDARARRVVVGSEDMHVYAFDMETGRRLWRSPKLAGVSFRGYHPVIAPDGSVMVTVTPAAALDTLSGVLLDMVREVFGDFASWRHTAEENTRLRAENFRLMEDSQTYLRQLEYLRKRLSEEPSRQTFFVLDAENGRPRFVTPIVYAESMNGTTAPPVVTPEGRVIVKYQALLRSRYEHYSPFLNVGYLDTRTGHIEPVMDQSRTYGWYDSLLLVHDEQSQLSVAGSLLFNTHQDNVNALDLLTLRGLPEPLARNIHEPRPREALAIWNRLWHGQPVPAGQEWLLRGTAVYGGGSVSDVPIAIAGDSFYYLPTHEMNAGGAVIAYRMAGTKPSEPEPLDLSFEWTAKDRERLARLPWDWDTLRTARLKKALGQLPETVKGTLDAPLDQQAREAVERITDDELDRFVWEIPQRDRSIVAVNDPLRAELHRAVSELLAEPWQPWQFPAGKHPLEAYRFFVEPTETIEVLALAFPHLDQPLRARVSQYVQTLRVTDGPLNRLPSHQADASQGKNRASYDLPPTRMLQARDDLTRTALARLYPLWLWAHAAEDWTTLKRDWPQLREHIAALPNPLDEDCRNGHLAGLIAAARIAQQCGDPESVASALAAARQAMRERLVYELAHPRGGLIRQVPVGRSIFARWRNLTPEVARLCTTYARPAHEQLMAVYVDYHRPAWWLAWNVETEMRNESPFQLPTASAEIFAARAWVLGQPREQLQRYLDLPWCRADLFYMRKLVQCLEADLPTEWRAIRPVP